VITPNQLDRDPRSLYLCGSVAEENPMRLLIAIAAAAAVSLLAPSAEAAGHRKKQRVLVVKVKPRSYLDAGTQVQPGSYQNYSLGLTPFRASDSIIPTGSVQSRLLPGPFGP
jgi:hypothetical protein